MTEIIVKKYNTVIEDLEKADKKYVETWIHQDNLEEGLLSQELNLTSLEDWV